MKPDLQAELNFIVTMLKDSGSIKRVYKEVRKKTRYNSVGDYPIISFICSVAKEIGMNVTKESLVEALKITQDREFKKVREDSQIVSQLCA